MTIVHQGDVAPILAIEGISHSFGSTRVLCEMGFDLRPGEVHALMGENGAGKSTLINLITGMLPISSGTIGLEGSSVKGLTPAQVRRSGISAVFQEFSLIPDRSVEENLFLGKEISRFGFSAKRTMRREAERILRVIGSDVHPGARIRDLSRSRQQTVEIGKALLAKPRVLILDEPTASLTHQEAERLFSIVKDLRDDGVGIIYVSHRMPEIKRLCDRVTIMRDGRRIATVQASEAGDEHLVELMAGRKIDLLYPRVVAPEASTRTPRLEVKGVTTIDRTVRDVSIQVLAGEVVGIAGLAGCGKSELARAVFGAVPIRSGHIVVDGETVDRATPRGMLARGVCYFSSDREAEGIAPDRPVRENVSATAFDQPGFSRMGMLLRRHEDNVVTNIRTDLQIKASNLEARTSSLSGGNKQKVVLARGFARRTRVFLFDEPTVGIDVGAKVEIYQLIADLVAKGAAVVLVSSDLPEIINLSTRVYVMHETRVIDEVARHDLCEQSILARFFSPDRFQDQARSLAS